MKHIKTTIESSLAIVKIERELYLNALNKDVIEELSVDLQILEKNQNIRAVIIIGSGQKAFVAGADIKEFAEYSIEQGEGLSKTGQENLFNKIENFKKPVIAAINGYALGGGLELALSCHMRVASENAKMGLPECSLGIIPGYGGTQRLVRTVGLTHATEMILTSKIIDADFAEKIGLINLKTTQEELLQVARKLGEGCVKNSPKSLESAIKCINKNFDQNGLSFEQKEFGKLFGTKEFKEGVSAFLEKRKPNY
jgi:enoyl-CoA hydratase